MDGSNNFMYSRASTSSNHDVFSAAHNITVNGVTPQQLQQQAMAAAQTLDKQSSGSLLGGVPLVRHVGGLDDTSTASALYASSSNTGDVNSGFGVLHLPVTQRPQPAGVQMNRPSSMDALNTIIEFLAKFMVEDPLSGEGQFSRKAIESLVKKLKEKRDELDSFINAVATAGRVETRCVTIPRTLDGRLQVAGRKGFPHVVYSKTFRFKGLSKNELRSIRSCQYGFDNKAEFVCVNPYHYERVQSIDLTGYRVGSTESGEPMPPRGPGRPSTRGCTGGSLPGRPKTYCSKGSPNAQSTFTQHKPQQLQQQQQPFGGLAGQSDPSGSVAYSANFDGTSQSISTGQPGTGSSAEMLLANSVQQIKMVSSHSGFATSSVSQQQPITASGFMPATEPISSSPLTMESSVTSRAFPYPQPQQSASVLAARSNAMSNEVDSAMPFYFNNPNLQYPQPSFPSSSSGTGNFFTPPSMINSAASVAASQNSSSFRENIFDVEPFNPPEIFTTSDALRMDTAQFLDASSTVATSSSAAASTSAALSTIADPTSLVGASADTRRFLVPRYITGVAELRKAPPHPAYPLISQKTLPPFWCQISYYEYDKQIGEIFHAPSSCMDVFVDGGLDAAGTDRFSIGAITSLQRTAEVERCRLIIGNGIMLSLRAEGDMWLTVLSHNSVFVQSRLLDIQAFRTSITTTSSDVGDAESLSDPCECRQFSTIKVFDLNQCFKDLKDLNEKRNMYQQLSNMNINGHMGISNLDESLDVGVDDMQELCTVKLSFVKGFGRGFRRRSIKETSCWISIQMNRALQLSDEVLNW